MFESAPSRCLWWFWRTQLLLFLHLLTTDLLPVPKDFSRTWWVQHVRGWKWIEVINSMSEVRGALFAFLLRSVMRMLHKGTAPPLFCNASSVLSLQNKLRSTLPLLLRSSVPGDSYCVLGDLCLGQGLLITLSSLVDSLECPNCR